MVYIKKIYVYMGNICRGSNRAAHRNNNKHRHTLPPFERALISMHDLMCVRVRGINYKLQYFYISRSKDP